MHGRLFSTVWVALAFSCISLSPMALLGQDARDGVDSERDASERDRGTPLGREGRGRRDRDSKGVPARGGEKSMDFSRRGKGRSFDRGSITDGRNRGGSKGGRSKDGRSSRDSDVDSAEFSGDIVFQDPRDQKMYENILGRLQDMKPTEGETAGKKDWFVVGGALRGAVKFNKFQGEEYVAQRIVQFVSDNNNRCQWQVFARATDESDADRMLGQIESDFSRRVAQAQRNQRQAAQRQASMTRGRSRSGGGSRGGGRGFGGIQISSGGC